MTSCDCSELQAENARLRAVITAAAPAVLRAALCLPNDTLAAMVWRLYRRAPGEWVALHDLELDLRGDRMSDINVVRVYIWRIRKAIGEGVIATRERGGYQLTEDGRAMVARALGET